MEVVVDLPGGCSADAGCLLQVLKRRTLHSARGAEMHEQGPLAGRTDARDLVERGRGQAFRPLRSVRSNSKPVSFVAQALEIEENCRIGLKSYLAPAGQVKDFAALASM